MTNPLRLPGARPLPTVAESTQATRDMATTAKAAASRRNLAGATRWPTGPGPLVHGRSSAMSKRCRQVNGHACATCREGDTLRARNRRAALREDTP